MRFPIFRNARLLLGALCFGLSLGAQAQNPTWQHLTHFQCSSPSISVEVTQLATDQAGNYYVGAIILAGHMPVVVRIGTTDSISYTPGGSIYNDKLLIVKFSPAGQRIWYTLLGSASELTGMALDSAGNIYVTYHGLDNAIHQPSTVGYLTSVTANGLTQWSRSVGSFGLGASLNPIDGLAVSKSGLIATLVYGRSVQFNNTRFTAPASTGFVGLYRPDGQFIRAIPITAPTGARIRDVGFDAADDLILTGSFNAPSATFGSTTLTSAGNTDLFVAKCDTAGQWGWASSAGGTGQDGGNALACYANGNVLVTGSMEGTTNLGTGGAHDVAIARLDGTTGQWRGSQFTGSPNVAATALAAMAGDRVAVAYGGNAAASFLNQPLPYQAGTDAFIGGLDLSAPSSAPWALAIGGANDEVVTALGALSTGLLVGGTFTSPQVTIGTQTLTRGGSTDSFVGLLVIPLGLPEATAAAALTLAPNPAHGTVQLTGLPAASTTQLLDALGRTVRTYPLAAQASDLELDLIGLPPGLYTVRCGAIVRRLVVE